MFTLQGRIERRLLINYRIDPEAVVRCLPRPFRPVVVRGSAVGGVCVIGLDSMRPSGFPSRLGLRSQNLAHRFAVEWDDVSGVRRGVYVPARCTDSWANALAGGRVFPGVLERARFEVSEDELGSQIRVTRGNETVLGLSGRRVQEFRSSLFDTVDEASEFFRREELAYSPARTEGCFDALELCCRTWRVAPFEIAELESSYFEDPGRFGPHEIEFDHALWMGDVAHEWRRRPRISRQRRRNRVFFGDD